MSQTYGYEIKTLYDSLSIKLDKSINTLESNYYINQVCLAYSKLRCLNTICYFLHENHFYDEILLSIKEYKMTENTPSHPALNTPLSQRYQVRKRAYIPTQVIWYDTHDYRDMNTFFKLFNVFEMPVVHIKLISPLRHNSRPDIRLAHDYDNDSLKLESLRHHSPPEYFVKAIEKILNYLLTHEREEELRKIELCKQRQDYLYKDLMLVEKIVSISKILSDDTVDDRMKLYVLDSLQKILSEQEKLHKQMGITPTITHIDLLA